jgi:hypothetical protein
MVPLKLPSNQNDFLGSKTRGSFVKFCIGSGAGAAAETETTFNIIANNTSINLMLFIVNIVFFVFDFMCGKFLVC